MSLFDNIFGKRTPTKTGAICRKCGSREVYLMERGGGKCTNCGHMQNRFGDPIISSKDSFGRKYKIDRR